MRNEEGLDTAAFLKLAGRFIALANRENRKVPASDLHMAFLWAAARYNAHVAKAVLDVANHETFVHDMAEAYKEMLRQNLADPGLDPDAGPRSNGG